MKMNLLDSRKIKENLKSFEDGSVYQKDGGRHPLARYASFDYCFNYFQRLKNKKEIASKNNIQNSCLQLGFYLASWGMYRGSAGLTQKSVKIFEPIIKYIASQEDIWRIDADNYTESNKSRLIECKNTIEKEIKIEQKDKDTLITKIMLGVFGNVPAFDKYFRMGSELGKVNENALEQISIFYTRYSKIISDEATRIQTLEYHDNNREGSRSYTKAKIVDMIFFIEGFEKNEKNIKKTAKNK